MKRLGLLIALIVVVLAGRPAWTADSDLTVDLSSHVVEIDSRFTGATLTMFGAISGPGDLVAVVRGPASDIAVRRKERTVGLWLNRDSMTFMQAPQYYAVVATAPVDRLLPADLRAAREIGVDQLRLQPAANNNDGEVVSFRDALVRQRTRDGLYLDQRSTVSVIDGRLFRVTLNLPAHVPTGPYRVDIMLVRDGAIVAERATPLSVVKSGLSAEISGFAHEHRFAYAAIAVAAALLAGWLGYVLFRKV
ncbi:MAG: hypothetical protein FJX66_02765 [Alphaproteobacteria bacterium]|nr:hypothetical protein [Alphaproteobacteria bacterium]